VHASLAALACSLWIAISAAAPEFIWQGAVAAAGHIGWTDALGAVLIGLVLAFFVEPVMEQMRDGVARARGHSPVGHMHGSAVFTVAVSVAFALVSVCLHHAITAFVAGHGAHPAEGSTGVVAALSLATAWAFVPFAITLAWLSRWRRWLRIGMGVLAALSSAIAAWLFDWGIPSALTTTIPCLVILVLGYRAIDGGPGRFSFRRCARIVGIVAAAWLVSTVFIEWLAHWAGYAVAELYPTSSWWEDARFYLGWMIGLMVAPPPIPAGEGAGPG
jgi:hypothetical protein